MNGTYSQCHFWVGMPYALLKFSKLIFVFIISYIIYYFNTVKLNLYLYLDNFIAYVDAKRILCSARRWHKLCSYLQYMFILSSVFTGGRDQGDISDISPLDPLLIFLAYIYMIIVMFISIIILSLGNKMRDVWHR